MFKKIAQKLKAMIPSDGPSVDPTQFSDAVAMETKWTPAKSGGANFRTHKIVPGFGTRLEFRTTRH